LSVANTKGVGRGWGRPAEAGAAPSGGAQLKLDVTPILRRRPPQEPRCHSIRAKVLYVLSRTDTLFPPSLAPGVMQALKDAGVDARYFEIDTELGHLASGLDADKWASALDAFMDELTTKA